MDHADATHFDSKHKTNTSRLDAEPFQENVINQGQNNPGDYYYDMSKKKKLHIFSNSQFEQTREFGNEMPEERTGTHFDVKNLEDTFGPLGFKVKKHEDFTYNKIKSAVRKIIYKDHKYTSCVALAILTHGSKDGYLFAKDQPYELKEIIKMLENQKLVLIPKLIFLQVSVVKNNMPLQPRVDKDLRRDDSWRSSFKRFRQTIPPQLLTCIRSPESAIKTDCAPTSNVACRGHALDQVSSDFHLVTFDQVEVRRNLVHVPSHIDFLILHSIAEDHASFMFNEGSGMIQQLCGVIQQYHSTFDILQLITLVNSRVAYVDTDFNSQVPSYKKMKQSLEASRLDAEPFQENVINQGQNNPGDYYYDMSKKKKLHILSNSQFEQTREFGNEMPEERTGTHFDVKILEDTFGPLGFKVKKHEDFI